MMALFRDSFFTRWNLSPIDDRAIERLRWISFEVPTAAAMNEPGGVERIAAELEALYHDRERVLEIVWQLCLPRAQKLGVSHDSFVRRVVLTFDVMRRELFAALSLHVSGDRLGTLIVNYHDGLSDMEVFNGCA